MFLLTVFAEDEKDILSDAIVRFKHDENEWFLRGRFMGYEKDKGYLTIPVNGSTKRLFHGDDVGDIFTKKFDKLKTQIILNSYGTT